MERKLMGRPLRTRGHGTVRVMKDIRGRRWVMCSGCQLEAYAPGVVPAKFEARQHADNCGR